MEQQAAAMIEKHSQQVCKIDCLNNILFIDTFGCQVQQLRNRIQALEDQINRLSLTN